MKRKRKRAKGSVRHLRRVVKRLRAKTGGRKRRRKRVHGRRRRHSGRRLPLRLLIERRDRLEQLIGERMARGQR